MRKYIVPELLDGIKAKYEGDMMDIATRECRTTECRTTEWGRFIGSLSDAMRGCRVRVDVEEYDLDNAFFDVSEPPRRAVFLNIQDSDKLLEVLFTESLKSKNIVSMTAENSMFFDRLPLLKGEFKTIEGVCLTIVLRQTPNGETNIDCDVMDSLAGLFAHNHEGMMI